MNPLGFDLFGVLGHGSNSCICVKATSKVGVFRADDKLLAGVVLFKAGEEGFTLGTAIDSNNYVRYGLSEAEGILFAAGF